MKNNKKKEMWHLIHPIKENEKFCGEKAANTIATDDRKIVECPECKKAPKNKKIT